MAMRMTRRANTRSILVETLKPREVFANATILQRARMSTHFEPEKFLILEVLQTSN